MRVRNQRSIRYFEASNSGGIAIRRRFGQLYAHMLIEDIGSYIWPFRAKDKVVVELTPTNKIFAEILVTALNNRYGGSLASSVKHFIEGAASQVAEFDFALAEIVFTEDSLTKEISAVNCVWINPEQIQFSHGEAYQRIPKSIAKERGVNEMIHLPKKFTMLFKAPPPLGSALKETRKALACLSDLRNEAAVRLITDRKVPFDWREHERVRMMAIAEAARPIAWPARGMFNEYVTTPYWVRLKILHEVFLSHLREEFLSTLQNGIERIGEVLGHDAKLVVRGFPTREELQITLNQLEAGAPPVNEILDAIMPR